MKNFYLHLEDKSFKISIFNQYKFQEIMGLLFLMKNNQNGKLLMDNRHHKKMNGREALLVFG